MAHFTGRGYRGKAMMVCIDKATAVRMYDKVQAHWKVRISRLKVMQTLRLSMRPLPVQYTKDIKAEKMARAYARVYDHYFGAGRSA